MEACSNLEVHINGEETIFLNKQILCEYSGTFRKLLGKSNSSNGHLKVFFSDFPGGAESFKLISRFCYGNSHLTVMPSNVVLLHCAAKFMEVTKVLEQTEKCMEEIRYWSVPEVLLCLKHCQEVETLSEADSLAAKFMDVLVEKLCLTVEASPSSAASACSPESSLFRFSCDSKSTESFKNSSVRLTWWFEEVLALSHGLIEMFLKLMVSRKFDDLIISRFLFYYQKVKFCSVSCNEKRKILETVIDTLCVLDQSCVPCKSLFGILRLALGLNINKSSMNKLEVMIGHQLDQATLDNLLVPSPSKSSHLYYVNLVLRFTKAFLDGVRGGSRLKKVASLIDQFIAEVAPDPCLKPSKFLSLLTLIPDSARESHEDLYRAIDMYLEAHAGLLTNAEKLNMIRTLNYEKLSGESRLHISRNPKFQAIDTSDEEKQQKQVILQMEKVEISGKNEKLQEHIQGIHWRVTELERARRKRRDTFGLRMFQQRVEIHHVSPRAW